jgi:hypothetical protein
VFVLDSKLTQDDDHREGLCDWTAADCEPDIDARAILLKPLERRITLERRINFEPLNRPVGKMVIGSGVP